ncbi:MAG: tripartite tricarboxylate transporter substrate binding protein [Reyranella sp.]|uniref:Bug family tripartite tricarboxylate transporter substrate binding protein n=1 Tax=Reyranella sp. TaxID=1929291 RepID=UPI001AD4D519|nr:tripartite tricarboxylate transporter substrate binding protein [Reyranella sp.]MBN9086960.1 tripartite tricarboxylate transporter substrate binding protein [Reyranella sp.]
MKRRTLLATSLAVPFVARAQQWPTRPIRLIVPYAPGATGDIGGRLYGEELGKTLGQSLVVDNKTGAGGTIAMAELARAAPDGYTLGVIAQGLLVYNLGLYKTPGYDPFRDLIVLSINFSVANVLIVHPSNPAKTVADVVEQARARKGEYTFSSGGIGTSHHMSGVLLEMRSGVKMTHVPYRATPAGIQAVVNGEVQMGMFNTPTVVGLIRAGKLKALAVTSEKRIGQFPELPTMIESGFKDFVVDTWLGFGAPAGLPQPLVTRLNGELNRITNLPEMRKKFDEQGIIAWPSRSPGEALKFLRQDSDFWLPIIKASGATAG